MASHAWASPPLIRRESSLGLFTWWQNGFSSKKGQAQYKNTFQASLTHHLVMSHWQTNLVISQGNYQMLLTALSSTTSTPPETRSERVCTQNTDRCLLALLPAWLPGHRQASMSSPEGMGRLLWETDQPEERQMV